MSRKNGVRSFRSLDLLLFKTTLRKGCETEFRGRYLFRCQTQNAPVLSRSGPVAGQQPARAAARHPRLASESSGLHPLPARVIRLARIAAAARLCSLRPGRRRQASLLRLAGLGGRRAAARLVTSESLTRLARRQRASAPAGPGFTRLRVVRPGAAAT